MPSHLPSNPALLHPVHELGVARVGDNLLLLKPLLLLRDHRLGDRLGSGGGGHHGSCLSRGARSGAVKKLLDIVLQAASRQNSSDCVGRTFLTLMQKKLKIFIVLVIFWPPQYTSMQKFNHPMQYYLLSFGRAQGNGNVSLVGTSKIFARTPLSWLIFARTSIFVAVSFLQRTSLPLTEKTERE